MAVAGSTVDLTVLARRTRTKLMRQDVVCTVFHTVIASGFGAEYQMRKRFVSQLVTHFSTVQ